MGSSLRMKPAVADCVDEVESLRDVAENEL